MTNRKKDSIKHDDLLQSIFDQTISESEVSAPKIFIPDSIEEFIRTHSNISENILKAYRKLVPEPGRGDDDFDLMFDDSQTHYAPYEITGQTHQNRKTKVGKCYLYF